MWVSGIAVVCWAVSGISHPLMAWFGPQAVNAMPPSFVAQADHVLQLERVIDGMPMDTATLAKVVPTELGPLLQVTIKDDEPRRYFNLADGKELANFDERQARWLAAHYLGRSVGETTQVRFRTTFDSAYPRVNRLLPVYEVDVGRGDKPITAYVHTETNALAGLTDATKANLQRVFQGLHTWSWLEGAGLGRVLIIAMFVVSLAAMATTGLYLVLALPRRVIPLGRRRWHRRMAYVLWVPMLGWSISGFYHLLQSEMVASVSGLRLGDAMALANFAVAETRDHRWENSVARAVPGDRSLNAMTLVMLDAKTPVYRLGVLGSSEENVSAHEQRKRRFSGHTAEQSVVYLDAQLGQIVESDDARRMERLARQFFTSQQPGRQGTVVDVTLVTQFGTGYDFRNKRLPVWQLDFDDEDKTRLFIDPVTGILVDQNRAKDRAESLVFSLLHKWNFLRPLIGPEIRDGLVVLTLIAMLALSGLGMALRYRRRKA